MDHMMADLDDELRSDVLAFAAAHGLTAGEAADPPGDDRRARARAGRLPRDRRPGGQTELAAEVGWVVAERSTGAAIAASSAPVHARPRFGPVPSVARVGARVYFVEYRAKS